MTLSDKYEPAGTSRRFGKPHSTLQDSCRASRACLGSIGEYRPRTSGATSTFSFIALLSIQLSVMSDKPQSGYPPPTSEWTPENQTCCIVWPGAGAEVQSVGTNSERRS